MSEFPELFTCGVPLLVLLDLARVQQVYRIVSFPVLGLLMIGASYLYHRLEKRSVWTTTEC